VLAGDARRPHKEIGALVLCAGRGILSYFRFLSRLRFRLLVAICFISARIN
jgi:hypothetical protein